jgi:tRNA-splicing ligase RtcB
MKIIEGHYSKAKVFTDNIDPVTIEQIQTFLNQEFTKDCKVRIMPDCHAGKGAVIGTTMEVKGKVCPNLVGVDIGCGMLCVELKNEKVDFAKLDEAIKNYVPSGQDHRTAPHEYTKHIAFDSVIAPIEADKVSLGLGTLGGGNHFIELNRSEDDRLFLVIHSGSRGLGTRVSNFHQKEAIKYHDTSEDELKELIERLKNEGREKEIQKAIQSFVPSKPNIPNDLAYLEGEKMEHYLHDLKIAQEFAKWNRAAMAKEIMDAMGFVEIGRIDTIHNYIDLQHMILRKGAISARKDELVIIPINMRDGSLLAKGKGNDDWNQSGPHGAGRILSRTKAKSILKLEDFQETMKDVYTTSVGIDTIDESPFAYKSMDEIIKNTKESIEVLEIIKPLYNFKAAEFTPFYRRKKKRK